MGEEWRILPWVGSGPRHDIEASLGRTEWRTAWRTEWKYASGGGWQPQVAGGGNDKLKGKPETGKSSPGDG